MTTRTVGSLEDALGYAMSTLGHRKTARLVRAAIFSDGIEDSKVLAPQLAQILRQSVDRQLAAGRTKRSPDTPGLAAQL